MPSHNALKDDRPSSFYHVYGRGRNRSQIFLDEQDFKHFLSIFRRHLSERPWYNRIGVAYPHLAPQVELVCFCLMSNHFHLLIFQKEEGAMQKLMHSVLTSYSLHFNKKYGRGGPLLESRYKASRITYHSYLEHITRYIHLNPRQWKNYKFSSLPFYIGKESASWLRPGRVLRLFAGRQAYLDFITNHESRKQIIESIEQDFIGFF